MDERKPTASLVVEMVKRFMKRQLRRFALVCMQKRDILVQRVCRLEKAKTCRWLSRFWNDHNWRGFTEMLPASLMKVTLAIVIVEAPVQLYPRSTCSKGIRARL